MMILLLGLIMERFYSTEWNSKTTPKKPVTINKIKSDFSGNEVAANRDYANQWVRLKGTVKNVKLDKDGKCMPI